jgi:hypothetical protein
MKNPFENGRKDTTMSTINRSRTRSFKKSCIWKIILKSNRAEKNKKSKKNHNFFLQNFSFFFSSFFCIFLIRIFHYFIYNFLLFFY